MTTFLILFSFSKALSAIAPSPEITRIPLSFKDCGRLRFVEIASSVEEIGDGAFAGCENVISITIKSDLPPIVGSNTFEGVESSVEIVVPALAMRYYKAAKGWNKFTNYVAID